MRDRSTRTLRRKQEGKKARLKLQMPQLYCKCGELWTDHEKKEITPEEFGKLMEFY